MREFTHYKVMNSSIKLLIIMLCYSYHTILKRLLTWISWGENGNKNNVRN